MESEKTSSTEELKFYNEYVENGGRVMDKDYFDSLDNLEIFKVLFEYDKLSTIHHTITKKKVDNVLIGVSDTLREKINKFMDNIEIKWFPGELWFAGGGMNLILDPSINENHRVYDSSDIDLFIVGTIERKKEIFNELLEDLKSKYEIEKIEYLGSVCNIKIVGKKRILQIIFGRNNSDMFFIEDFDYPHLKVSFDGMDILFNINAWKAFRSKISCRVSGLFVDHKYYRINKGLIRGYVWYEKPKTIKDKNKIENFDNLNLLLSDVDESKKTKPWISTTLDEVKETIKYEGILDLIEGY